MGDKNEMTPVRPPLFRGKNPDLWVKQIEYLCEVKKINSSLSKFAIAIGLLDKEQSLICQDLIENFTEYGNIWEEFKKRMCLEESLSKRERIWNALDSVKDIGTKSNNLG